MSIDCSEERIVDAVSEILDLAAPNDHDFNNKT